MHEQVWQTCLSEKERRFLAQFLPRETEPQEAVKQLLAGENFHFGNPFLDWLVPCICYLISVLISTELVISILVVKFLIVHG